MTPKRRLKVTNFRLIESMPTGVYFTEKDCFLNGNQIDITHENFNRRIRVIDPDFKCRKVKRTRGFAVEFYLTKSKKAKLLERVRLENKFIGGQPKTYHMKLNGVMVSFTNMVKFCRDNDLSITCMRKVNDGGMHEYKGWTNSESLPLEKPTPIIQAQDDYFLMVMRA